MIKVALYCLILKKLKGSRSFSTFWWIFLLFPLIWCEFDIYDYEFIKRRIPTWTAMKISEYLKHELNSNSLSSKELIASRFDSVADHLLKKCLLTIDDRIYLLSEIEFYYKGEKVEIDISGIEWEKRN